MPWFLTGLVTLVVPVVAFSQATAAEWFAEAGKSYQKGDRIATRRALERTIELAASEQNRQIEADARAYLAEGLKRGGEYAAASAEFQRALGLYEQLGNRSRAASVKTFLANIAFSNGDRDKARAYYEEALAVYESLNNLAAMANLHHSLTFFTTGDEEKRHIDQGLELARRSGARHTEALLLHAWGDRDYASDDFRSALDRLDQARSIFEELGDRDSLARVLTSLGRLYRVHGHADQALPFYQRALELQKESGEKQGIIQSLNAITVALNILGRNAEALRNEEEALRLARETGSSLLIKFILEGIASSHLYLKQYQKAADVLEEARQLSPPRSSTLNLLSEARFQLKQYPAALQAAEEGLQLQRDRDVLQHRAVALWKLRRTPEALSDIREVLDGIERARATLVPTDFMKQGFSDTYRYATNLAVRVFLDNGQAQEALAIAEQARGRAFLDLLATRNLASRVESLTEQAANEAASGPSTRSAATWFPPLLTRGDSSAEKRITPAATRPAELPSVVTASAATMHDLAELAARLNSTILSYWIDADSTIIWTISPEGRVTSARTNFGEETLTKWIDEALHPVRQPNTRGGVIELPSRAGDTVLTSQGSHPAWRRLYDALIRPVRANLPSKGPRRLTIIPSGPLFRLSFAALKAEDGRYLIEDYSIHYAPAGGVLKYTSLTKTRTADLPARYVLVANPAGMPPMADGKSLPRLPGSDEEVRKIAQLFPSGDVITLRGNNADETAVRKAIPSAKVIHFATHGIVKTDDALGSFLALSRTAESAAADGRLTAEEVYGLDLHADLVVLSACRTGLGQISTDGVAGLARAFFYAGASSVVSTLWDVADEPASQLIADFYRSFANRTETWTKGEAMRTAQLHLLRSLRNGQLQVSTPFGKVPLPEDPILWAGFVVMGEP
ncbi:MAG TPA: CHAT domain-containing protein [Terriglobia bacterium]|nr:CHAT domain-containing protein [Terriglobia bacterium]